MQDDIREAQPEEQGGNMSAGKRTSKVSPYIAMLGVGVIIIAAFVIGFAIAYSFIVHREPAPDKSALAAGMYCSSWSNAPANYQTAIEAAANAFTKVGDKIPIQSALLGAIFLSEHGDSWPQKDITDTDWAQGGAGVGPFQLENFENKWKTVSELGLSSKIYPKPSGAADDSTKYADPQNFDDAALAAGGVIYETAHAGGINIPLNTTDQNEVKCLAAGYNGGSGMCKTWKDSGYSASSPPPTTNQYEERAWTSFQDLNIGCQSLTAAGLLNIPFLSQTDATWNSAADKTTYAKYFPEGAKRGNPFAQSGCAATSAAMVASFLTGNNITPPMEAEKFYAGRGTADYAAFSPTLLGNGITGKAINAASVGAELKAKHPVIMHIVGHAGGAYGGAHSGGHYVVITGFQGSDFVTNDPITSAAGTIYSGDLSKYLGGVEFYSFSS